MDLDNMTAKQLRDFKTPRTTSIEELNETIKALVDRSHDYNTSVYAMSIAAEATFNYVAGRLGVTGFQASCAAMDFLRQTRDLEAFQIIDFSQVLYPQYHDKINGISVDSIIADNKDWLKDKCTELIKNANEFTSEEVMENWKRILKKCEEES